MGPLEDFVFVQFDDVSTVLDLVLHLLVQFLTCNAQHENKGSLDAVEQNLG